jgi:type III pantothenate kinase
VTNNPHHFIIDQGNSLTKVALFQAKNLISLIKLKDDEQEKLTSLIAAHPSSDIFISSVRSETTFIEASLGSTNRLIYFERGDRLPFAVRYQTPETLGLDRLANAAGAVDRFGDADVLVIDCGTCITSTFIKSGVLEGGSISPGLRMRAKALNHYTGKLPLVDLDHSLPELIGRSTKDSILSGIIRGTIQEIQGIITEYCSENAALNVIVTGGDGGFLGSYLKSPIFANENLTLLGLNKIYLFNYCEKNI